MLKILRYEEDLFGGDKSELSSITELPIEYLDEDLKQNILDYLFNRNFRQKMFIPGGFLTDPFTGELMHATRKSFDDGKWCWFDDLPNYLYLHDIMLPEEFIDDVIDFYNNGGTVEPIFCFD